jgi:signal transduction histidine kinase
MAASLVLDFAPFIDNSNLTGFYAVFLVLILSGGMLIAAFVREKDLVVRKQIQWVVAGFAVYGLWGGINVLFWAAGGEIPPEAVILPMIAVPVCWAVAVTKFRLMDIDDLFDHAVIFAVTIAVLQAIELVFLGLVSPHVPLMQRAPYLSLSAMLVIVFLYLPVRTRVKTGVERLFKRNSYEADEELRKFISGLSGRDTAAILGGFFSFAKDLLGPSGAGVIQFRNDIAAAVQALGGGARGTMDYALSGAGALRAHIGLNREAVFGYELADKGVLDPSPSFPEIGGSLFIPVFLGAECAYIIVLLPKWNSSPYTRKDRRLLQAAATSMAHALEAEKRRDELDEERLRLAREIHDGISSEFTAILAYGERGARFLDEASSREAARGMFMKIVDASRRGIRELRNIIWALNAENHSLQFLSSYIKRYVSDLLNVNGIAVAVKEANQNTDALLPPPVFLALFRTVQELCQNVLKHAAADHVAIELRESHGRIVLSFADNGRGLPSGPATRTTGYGLNNIRKRMEDLGGAVEVSSAQNKGTRVEIQVPLA